MRHKGFPICLYYDIRALLRRGLHPFRGRYQDGTRQSRPRHRRLYPGRIRARHRPNETGERPPHGELHQGRFRPIRENIREKTIEKTRYPLRDNGFHWSCYPDLNWRPHPYQLQKSCYSLLLSILPCCLQPITPQLVEGFFHVFRCLLPLLKKVCFLMPVSVLCRFLLEHSQADLIPFHHFLLAYVRTVDLLRWHQSFVQIYLRLWLTQLVRFESLAVVA